MRGWSWVAGGGGVVWCGGYGMISYRYDTRGG